MKKVISIVFVVVLAFYGTALALPITYYDLDFEDGTFGGGFNLSGFGEATNISPSNLDGSALYFDVNDQMVWQRNAADSTTHYVAFDYYSQPGANVTQFLDIPSILRLDVRNEGQHHIDVYYDLSTEQTWSYLDGTLDSSLLTILAWPSFPASGAIRIANQASLPGDSDGDFEIDNLLWQGDVDLPVAVPEPSTLLLLGTGLVGLAGFRRKFKG
jgi:hypothetical protein